MKLRLPAWFRRQPRMPDEVVTWNPHPAQREFFERDDRELFKAQTQGSFEVIPPNRILIVMRSGQKHMFIGGDIRLTCDGQFYRVTGRRLYLPVPFAVSAVATVDCGPFEY